MLSGSDAVADSNYETSAECFIFYYLVSQKPSAFRFSKVYLFLSVLLPPDFQNKHWNTLYMERNDSSKFPHNTKKSFSLWVSLLLVTQSNTCAKFKYITSVGGFLSKTEVHLLTQLNRFVTV